MVYCIRDSNVSQKRKRAINRRRVCLRVGCDGAGEIGEDIGKGLGEERAEWMRFGRERDMRKVKETCREVEG